MQVVRFDAADPSEDFKEARSLQPQDLAAGNEEFAGNTVAGSNGQAGACANTKWQNVIQASCAYVGC